MFEDQPALTLRMMIEDLETTIEELKTNYLNEEYAELRTTIEDLETTMQLLQIKFPDDNEPTNKYCIGQKVIYEYDGEEYICEIIDVNGNRYDITCDDIIFENVPEDRIHEYKQSPQKQAKVSAKVFFQQLAESPVKAKEPEPEPEPKQKPKPTKSKYRTIPAKHPDNIQVAAIRSESNNPNLAEFELYEIISGTEEENNIIVSENPIGKFVRGKNGKAGKCEWYEPEPEEDDDDDVPYASETKYDTKDANSWVQYRNIFPYAPLYTPAIVLPTSIQQENKWIKIKENKWIKIN